MPAGDQLFRFTWNPDEYRRSSTAQQQWAIELIAKLALSGKERVLDIGCGDGKVTAEIARRLPDGIVVGIDSSPEMVQYACDQFPKEDYQNLTFVEMDALALTFFEEFDAVFSNAALHWVIDHRTVLTGVKQALRPGGKLLFQMGGRGNAEQAFEACETLMQDPRWAHYFDAFTFPYSFFGTGEYRSWLEETGFEPVRVELIPKDMAFKTRWDFAGWIRTTWLPYLVRIPDEFHPAFIDALIDQYLKLCPADEQGTIHIGMVRLEAEAKKTVSKACTSCATYKQSLP
jgi:trans-aconitate methyltransferase